MTEAGENLFRGGCLMGLLTSRAEKSQSVGAEGQKREK